MDIQKFLLNDMLVLIPVLYVLGMMLKGTPNVKDWTIPWILLVIGVACAIGIGIGVGLPIVSAIVQGILVTGATVYVNQLVVQTKNKEE